MPETTLLADSIVDIAKDVLVKMPCKWGECESVLNSWNMLKEVWHHPLIKFFSGKEHTSAQWLGSMKSSP
jgi:hypothetical protein